MKRPLLGVIALVAAALGLGVGLGRVSRTAPEPILTAATANDARVLRELEKLDARVRQLSVEAPVRVEPAPTLAPSAAGAAASPSTPAEPLDHGQTEPPTPAQIEAGDRLVALAERVIASGRITPEDRQALRAAASEADAERRDETMLALVRSLNAQRVKPTEPGPPF